MLVLIVYLVLVLMLLLSKVLFVLLLVVYGMLSVERNLKKMEQIGLILFFFVSPSEVNDCILLMSLFNNLAISISAFFDVLFCSIEKKIVAEL